MKLSRRQLLLLIGFSAVGAAVVASLYLMKLARVDGVGVPPLDDTYIHLRYAQLLAKGYFFHYVPGEGYTTGATSPAYVALLALFFRVGLSDAAVTWIAYGLGAVALGLGAFGAGLAAWRATEDSVAMLIASALVLACGSLTANSLSGMETGAYAAMLVVTLAATFTDGPVTWRLLLLYTLLPLLRPDGAVFVFLFAAGTAWRTRGEKGLLRASLRLLPVFAPFVLYLLGNLILTGDLSTAGMRLKSFSSDIYTDKPHAVWQLLEQAWLRLPDVFASKLDPALLPGFIAPFAVLGLVLPGPRKFARAVLAIALVVGYLALNNTRGNIHGWQRYFVPLYPLVAVAAAMGVHALTRWLPRFRLVAAAVVGVALVVGLGLSHRAWRANYARESTEISRKQVQIAHLIRDLPPDAYIATMDVGAVAFIGGHRTFDVIGLTTNGVYPYALLEVPGRVESLGSLPASDRPEFAALYGSSLPKEAIAQQLSDARGFLLYKINWASFDAANHPAHVGAVVDRVDVADPRSEAAHGYAFEPRYLPVNQRAEMRSGLVAGAVAIDSARPVTHEAFTVAGHPGVDAVLIVRTVGSPTLAVTWNGKPLTVTKGATEGGFVELEAPIPAADVLAANHVDVSRTGPGRYSSYYWFVVQ